jgi:hypothetical protein
MLAGLLPGKHRNRPPGRPGIMRNIEYMCPRSETGSELNLGGSRSSRPPGLGGCRRYMPKSHCPLIQIIDGMGHPTKWFAGSDQYMNKQKGDKMHLVNNAVDLYWTDPSGHVRKHAWYAHTRAPQPNACAHGGAVSEWMLALSLVTLRRIFRIVQACAGSSRSRSTGHPRARGTRARRNQDFPGPLRAVKHHDLLLTGLQRPDCAFVFVTLCAQQSFRVVHRTSALDFGRSPTGNVPKQHFGRPKAGQSANFGAFPVAVRPKTGPEGRSPVRKHYCET